MQLDLYLLGAPGVGKGTQAQRLAAHLHIPQLSTGDMLRDARQEGSELGKQVAAIMDSGKLVSDDIVIALVKQRLARPDHAAGVIFDGFPRTRVQAEALDRLLQETGRQPLRVVVVDVGTDEIRRRLLGRLTCPRCKRSYHQTDSPPQHPGRCDACGSELVVRNDDRPEVVEKRLQAYLAETAPLVDYYQRKGRFYRVDGTGSIDQVFQLILGALAASLPTP